MNFFSHPDVMTEEWILLTGYINQFLVLVPFSQFSSVDFVTTTMVSSKTPSKGKASINLNNPNPIENLSSDFATKIKMSYRSAPSINYSDRMKAKLLERNKLSLFVKILDGKLLAGTFKLNLEKTWAPFRITEMHLYKGDIYQVWMENQHQIEMILQAQPWVVSQHILQIVPWMEMKEHRDLDFNKFFVWMQLINFPEIFQDREIVEGNLIDSGCFSPNQLFHMELYPKHNDFVQLTRVKVLMDISDPIPPGFKLPEAVNGVEWVQFSYENLPVCCFKCGFIGHHQASCNIADADLSVEPQFTSNGQRFEMYNPKTRIFPKPMPDRPVSAVSLLNQFDVPRVYQPLRLREDYLQEHSNRPSPIRDDLREQHCRRRQDKGKEPLIMEINSPEPYVVHPTNLGPSSQMNNEWTINNNPVNYDTQFPNALVFSSQIPGQHMNGLPNTSYVLTSQGMINDPTNIPYVDLSGYSESDLIGENSLPYKRQEIEHGMTQRDNNEMRNAQRQIEFDGSMFQDREQRRKSALNTEQWQMLESLNPGNNQAWLCAGDFNDILYRGEKRGGRLVYQWQCQPFADMIQNCAFMDLGFVGPIFTGQTHEFS
ncbi:hypothetical protein IFM89_020982 [Coptis chinensis]|uniref:CCHC-type domain-containing protein n=1 Tax=Coptis chinensis TaxID=261450 RepID=A0A835I9K5_9MAGN|nr:hypothetical protein IFM89_020982 [Coptis chinensis]